MTARLGLVVLSTVTLTALAFGADPTPLPAGAGQFAHKIGDKTLDVYTYRPAKFDPKVGRIVLVFHGVNRNAEEYRDWAKPIAEGLQAVVAAPRFTKEAFPTAAYQQGNLLAAGKPKPKEEWTWSLVSPLADAVRQRAGRADAPYYLIGHSAGGQFLTRLAGFVETGAAGIVAANPGTHLFPIRDAKYPLGYGGLPEGLSDDPALRKYLAQPLTFYLGTGDTVADMNLDVTPAAMKQGENRYQRGKNAFQAGKDLAAAKGWPFKWRLVEAPDVGHFAEKMFAHPNCRKALLGAAD